jgi:hypothetical protein
LLLLLLLLLLLWLFVYSLLTHHQTPPLLSPSSRGAGKVVEADVFFPKPAKQLHDELLFADSPSRPLLKKARSSKTLFSRGGGEVSEYCFRYRLV